VLFEYSLIVMDSIGLETLTSIKEFDRPYFPNDTQIIRLKGEQRNANASLKVEIRFQRNPRDLNRLEIYFEGNAAREVVQGIANEILHRLEPYKTSNYLFANLYSIGLSLLLTGVGLALLLDSKKEILPSHGKPVGASLLLLGVFLGSLALLRPYASFNTRRNEKIDGAVKWIVLGVITFLTFTVVGVYFRLKLFGF
jgi:hypothetical protein